MKRSQIRFKHGMYEYTVTRIPGEKCEICGKESLWEWREDAGFASAKFDKGACLHCNIIPLANFPVSLPANKFLSILAKVEKEEKRKEEELKGELTKRQPFWKTL